MNANSLYSFNGASAPVMMLGADALRVAILICNNTNNHLYVNPLPVSVEGGVFWIIPVNGWHAFRWRDWGELLTQEWYLDFAGVGNVTVLEVVNVN